jgi:excisionase family DNA binding protein
MPKEKLIGVKEAADQLGVQINTLYSWIYLRKIEHVKVGRLVKFKQSTIDRFLNDHTIPMEKY